MDELILSERMPVLAMRGLVLFPQATMHFDVGREKSVRALEAAMNADQHIFLVTQKKIEQDDPGFGDLYEIGTVAHVLQVLKIPGDTVRVLVQGEYRARATQMLQTVPCMMARVESIPEEETPSITPRTEALLRQAIELFGEYAERNRLSWKKEKERGVFPIRSARCRTSCSICCPKRIPALRPT